VDGFGAGVDQAVSHVRVFGPGGDQTPAQGVDFAPLWPGEDHRHPLAGRDVVAFVMLQRHGDGLEMLLQRFDRFRQAVTSAHDGPGASPVRG